jgi:PAS domain-containing protein
VNCFGLDWPSKAPNDREVPPGAKPDHSGPRAGKRLTVGLFSAICVCAPVAVSSFLFADWETQPAFMAAGAIARIVILISSAVLIGRTVQQRHVARNATLSAVLNNMSQGICMFDSEQRVIVSNELYAKMYGLTSQQVAPGTRLRQIQEARSGKTGFVDPLTEAQFVERLRTAASGGAVDRRTLRWPHHFNFEDANAGRGLARSP